MAEIQSFHHYVSQHKDNDPDVYDVVRCDQTWVNGWPRDDKREVVMTGVSREYAHLMVSLLDGRSVAEDRKRCIEFYMSCETNRNTAEAIHHFPQIY